jgi:hypothetical protein
VEGSTSSGSRLLGRSAPSCDSCAAPRVPRGRLRAASSESAHLAQLLLVTPAPRALGPTGSTERYSQRVEDCTRAGYAVTVSSAKRVAMAAWSRATERRITLPDATDLPRALRGGPRPQCRVPLLGRARTRYGASLLPISAARDELEPACRGWFASPPCRPCAASTSTSSNWQRPRWGLAPRRASRARIDRRRGRRHGIRIVPQSSSPPVVPGGVGPPDAALEQRGPSSLRKRATRCCFCARSARQ